VPVLGTLAAPLPGASYAAGYAPASVGGVSVSASVTSNAAVAHGLRPSPAPLLVAA
jgi:hypothetical protein